MALEAKSPLEGGKKKKFKVIKRLHRRDAENPEVRRALEKKAVETLPPPGDYRREVQRMREDELLKEADRLSYFIDGAVGNNFLKELDIDPITARLYNRESGKIEFTGQKRGYIYRFIRNWDKSIGSKTGAAIRAKLGEYGWEVVRGYECTKACRNGRYAKCEHQFPEAPELMAVDNTREWIDTTLMRIRKEDWLVHQAHKRKAMRAKHGNPIDNELLQSRFKSARPQVAENWFKRMVAQGAATKQFTDLLKQGRMPGMVDPRQMQQGVPAQKFLKNYTPDQLAALAAP